MLPNHLLFWKDVNYDPRSRQFSWDTSKFTFQEAAQRISKQVSKMHQSNQIPREYYASRDKRTGTIKLKFEGAAPDTDSFNSVAFIILKNVRDKIPKELRNPLQEQHPVYPVENAPSDQNSQNVPPHVPSVNLIPNTQYQAFHDQEINFNDPEVQELILTLQDEDASNTVYQALFNTPDSPVDTTDKRYTDLFEFFSNPNITSLTTTTTTTTTTQSKEAPDSGSKLSGDNLTETKKPR